MLLSLFDRYCSLVAYLDRDRYLFDPDMNWIAFIDNKQVWSLGLKWVGPVNGLICMDRDGKVVAWGIGQKVAGDPSLHRKPKYTPPLPAKPTSFLRPMLQNPPVPGTPLLGWSHLSFKDWIKG